MTYDPEKECLIILQNLVNEYHELNKMRQDYKNMKYNLEQSYPEFNEILDDEDNDKQQKDKSILLFMAFERHKLYLSDFNLIKDHGKRIQDKRIKIRNLKDNALREGWFNF